MEFPYAVASTPVVFVYRLHHLNLLEELSGLEETLIREYSLACKAHHAEVCFEAFSSVAVEVGSVIYYH
jgi:hypothetical protein